MRFALFLLVLLPVTNAAAIEPPSGATIIPIDLEKLLIRVAATCKHIAPEQVLADIGFSTHLVSPPKPPVTATPKTMVVHADDLFAQVEAGWSQTTDYELIAIQLRSGDKFQGVFKTGFTSQNTTVGLLRESLNSPLGPLNADVQVACMDSNLAKSCHL